MNVTAYVLRDIKEKVPVPLNELGYREFFANPDWRRNLISFTSLLYHPARKTIICGLTAFDTDLLYEFNPQTEVFSSLGFDRVSERFEIKIHRSLYLAGDDNLYGATACLHREDQRAEAPGGRLFRYDFRRESFDFLGRPVSHDYIQTIAVDETRGLIYGITYPVFEFFVFDLATRTTRYRQYVGSASHLMAIDDYGCIWSTWSQRTHHLFKYDPAVNKVCFFNHGLMDKTKTGISMYPGAGPVDMMLNGRDGFLYVGLTDGTLARLDPKSAAVETLGKPEGEPRLPALSLGPDGQLYGVAGFNGKCRLFAYHRKSKRFADVGPIEDQNRQESCFIAHDMCWAGEKTLFTGETDTADRAGRLWRCDL